MSNKAKKRKSDFSDNHKNKTAKKTNNKKVLTTVSDKKKISKNKKNVHYKAFHDSIKNLTCLKCGKILSSTSNLYRHLKIHTDIKKISCSKCRLKFSTNSNMHRHERLVHKQKKKFSTTKIKLTAKKSSVEQKQPQFSCDVCGSKLSHRRSLYTHIHQIHGNPYKCDACNKSLLSRTELKNHKCALRLKSNVCRIDNIFVNNQVRSIDNSAKFTEHLAKSTNNSEKSTNNSAKFTEYSAKITDKSAKSIDNSTESTENSEKFNDNSANDPLEESDKIKVNAQQDISTDDLINNDEQEQKIICIVCKKDISTEMFWEHKMRHLRIVDLSIENINLNKSQQDNIVKLNEGKFYVRNLKEVLLVRTKSGITIDDTCGESDNVDTYSNDNISSHETLSSDPLCDKRDTAPNGATSNGDLIFNYTVENPTQVEEKTTFETPDLFDIDELLKSDSEDEIDNDTSKDTLNSDDFYGFVLEPNSKPPTNPLLRKYFDLENLEGRMKSAVFYADSEKKRNTLEISSKRIENITNIIQINTNTLDDNTITAEINMTENNTNVKGNDTNTSDDNTNTAEVNTNIAKVKSNTADKAKNYTIYKRIKEIFLTSEDLMKIGSNDIYNYTNATDKRINTSENNSNSDIATKSTIQVRTDLNIIGTNDISIDKGKVINRNTLSKIDTNCESNENLAGVRNSLKNLFLEQEKKSTQENTKLNKQIYLSDFKTCQNLINSKNMARIIKDASQKTNDDPKTTNCALKTTKDALEKTKNALKKILESPSKKTIIDNFMNKMHIEPRRSPAFKCNLCYEVFYHKLGLKKHYILTHLNPDEKREDEVNKEVLPSSLDASILTERYKCPLDNCRHVVTIHDLKSGAAVCHLIRVHKIFPNKFIKSGRLWVKI